MSKLKSALFILVVGLVHLFCTFALIADKLSRFSCNVGPQTMCVTPMSRVIEAILGFPFFTFTHLLGLDGHFQSLFLMAFVLNSLVAATFIWFVTSVCTRLWKRGRNRA